MDNIQGKFLHEATELIDDLEKALLQLENNPRDTAQVEEVFRVMHTFKGTAKMFGFDKIGEFTHHLESVFAELRNGRIAVTDEILDVTLRSVDHIRHLLDSGEQLFLEEHDVMMDTVKQISSAFESKGTRIQVVEEKKSRLYLIKFKPHQNFLQSGNNPIYLIDDLSALGNVYCKTYTNGLPPIRNFVADYTYLHWDILLYTSADSKSIRSEFIFVEDRCDLSIEDLGADNLLKDQSFMTFIESYENELHSDLVLAFLYKSSNARPEARGKNQMTASRNVSQTIKVTYDKIDKLMGIVSELVTTQARLSLFADGTKAQELEEISENIEKLVRQLRDETFSISLLPISHLSMRFERLVRDMSKSLNKQIRFVTVGGDTELDKKIIENLVDPMLHILRNGMDHGIETPQERKLKGKDETGTIQLKAYYSGTNVIIEIKDDGNGINKDRVWQKALQKGLVKQGDVLTDSEIYQLIFEPGFSTAKEVTDVSGRGVGMDVVSKAVKNLRGEIEIQSSEGVGSTFKLKLPLSLSIMDGLLVKVSQATYVIPLTAIDKCYELTRDLVAPDLNGLIVLDGNQIPYINLRQLFNYDEYDGLHSTLIVARHEDRRVVFEVDNIIDEYQAVIKPLGRTYKNQDFASGATILGNGTVALVLDVNRLVARLSDN